MLMHLHLHLHLLMRLHLRPRLNAPPLSLLASDPRLRPSTGLKTRRHLLSCGWKLWYLLYLEDTWAFWNLSR